MIHWQMSSRHWKWALKTKGHYGEKSGKTQMHGKTICYYYIHICHVFYLNLGFPFMTHIWISFALSSIPLAQGKFYSFKLKRPCSQMINTCLCHFFFLLSPFIDLTAEKRSKLRKSKMPYIIKFLINKWKWGFIEKQKSCQY